MLCPDTIMKEERVICFMEKSAVSKEYHILEGKVLSV